MTSATASSKNEIEIEETHYTENIDEYIKKEFPKEINELSAKYTKINHNEFRITFWKMKKKSKDDIVGESKVCRNYYVRVIETEDGLIHVIEDSNLFF